MNKYLKYGLLSLGFVVYSYIVFGAGAGYLAGQLSQFAEYDEEKNVVVITVPEKGAGNYQLDLD